MGKDRQREIELRTAEERLAQLSVLTELTAAALSVADPATPVDEFLQRLAERMGCLAVLLVELPPGAGCPRLRGSAGLSRASRALPLGPAGSGAVGHVGSLTFPQPELAGVDLVRWFAPVGNRPEEGERHLVFFSPSEPSPAYRAIAERLAGQLRAALEHRRLVVDLRASYRQLERAQKALLVRERLAALGELAAVVAHEVRNPLGAIFNGLASLRKLIPQGGAEATLVGILGEESDRLNRIGSELLEFARPSAAALESEPLDPLLDAVVELARSSQEAGDERVIDLEVSGDLSEVPHDRHQLTQALLNLVINALQATPPGGRVRVHAALERVEGGELVRIDVVDVGLGIPSEVRGRIFEPFFTTKSTGTGLGLAVVKRIVDSHQGELFFHSTDEGTKFSVRLPMS